VKEVLDTKGKFGSVKSGEVLLKGGEEKSGLKKKKKGNCFIRRH